MDVPKLSMDETETETSNTDTEDFEVDFFRIETLRSINWCKGHLISVKNYEGVDFLKSQQKYC